MSVQINLIFQKLLYRFKKGIYFMQRFEQYLKFSRNHIRGGLYQEVSLYPFIICFIVDCYLLFSKYNQSGEKPYTSSWPCGCIIVTPHHVFSVFRTTQVLHQDVLFLNSFWTPQSFLQTPNVIVLAEQTNFPIYTISIRLEIDELAIASCSQPHQVVASE